MQAVGETGARLEIDPRCPLLLSMTFNSAQVAGNAGIRVLARSGAPGLTLPGVAAELRMTPQGVRRWFGSAEGMRQAVAEQIGSRWNHWLVNDHRSFPPEAAKQGPGPAWLLPLGDHEIAPTRAWLAISQAALDDPLLGAVLEPHLAREKEAVANRIRQEGRELSPDQVELLLAAVRGLRQEVCRLHDAMPAQIAQAHLRRLLDALTPQ